MTSGDFGHADSVSGTNPVSSFGSRFQRVDQQAIGLLTFGELGDEFWTPRRAFWWTRPNCLRRMIYGGRRSVLSSQELSGWPNYQIRLCCGALKSIGV